MTLDKARELLSARADLGGGHNRNAAKRILAEVQREHGQTAVDRLTLKLALERVFGLKPGTDYTT